MDIPAVEAASNLFPYFDWGATLLWAASGAMLAARRGYDPIGVFGIALVSAAGGGLLRDGLFLQNGPPVVVQSPIYLGLILAATLLVLLFGGFIKTLRWFDRIVITTDAIGLGTYAIVGMNMALSAHLSFFGVAFVGVVNAVGGSVLRDLLMGTHPPEMFKPGVPLASASLMGCVLFLILLYLDVDKTLAGVATVVAVFAFRMLALNFGFKTSALSAFRDDWHDPGAPRD